MRYSLRTLIILLLILPPLGAWGWREYGEWRERQRINKLAQLIDTIIEEEVATVMLPSVVELGE